MPNAKPDTDSGLDDLIRKTTQSDLPVEVEERLRRRLAEFQAKVEQQSPGALPRLAHWLTRSPVFRMPAVAAMLLAALVAALIVVPGGPREGRVYAQAIARIRVARSVQYKLVLAPYTEVEFSYLAPRYRRVNCSWGIEVRTDDAGRQIVLLHWTRQYALEEATHETVASAMDLVDQLRALPRTADETLGEQQAGDKRLIGYRLRHLPAGAAIGNLKMMDLWVDRSTGQPDHVDITIQEPGKPLYKMQIRDIRLDGAIDPAQFSTTPPAGYRTISAPHAEKRGVQATERHIAPQPEIKQAEAMTAVVVRMKGSYLQTRTAVEAVESCLKELGVAPAGSPFGRFGSEQDWDAGYPVPSGTRIKAPFETITLPATTVASVIVPGPWGQDSDSRWAAFLKWVVEHGYVPAGPPMEFWSGEDAKLSTQSTEMRLAVRKAN
jgi:effector-binding domain-containing protein